MTAQEPTRPPAGHLRRAYDEGRAAALRGEEAAPGCTTTPERRAFLRGYVDGAAERPGAAGR
jgi:hypothetical protein